MELHGMNGKKELPAGLILALMVFSLYAVTARGRIQTSDEAAVLATAVNAVTERTLAVDNLAWIQPLVPGTVYPGRDGRLYAKYFPGNAAVAGALYALGRTEPDAVYWWNALPIPSRQGAQAALLTNPLLGALGMGALFVVLLRRFDRRTALLAALGMALGTDWWYQSRGFFSEVGAGAFLILSVCFADAGSPWGSAIALGLSLLFRPTNILGLPFWIWSLWRAGRLRDGWAWASGLGILGGIGLLLAYNAARFGSPFDFGYGQEPFNHSILAGVGGLLFSPGRSLFLYSPILLPALPGLVCLWRRERGLAACILLVSGSYLLLIASWHSWEGGWAWGTRLLIPIFPLLGLAVGVALDASRQLAPPLKRAAWGGTFVLMLLGLGINGLAMTNDPVEVLVQHIGRDVPTFDAAIRTPDCSQLVLQLKDFRWEPERFDIYWVRRAAGGDVGIKP